MKITIKSYKSCRGNEGDAFSCTVYLDGKKAAHVQYDGWGGEYMWDFHVSDGQMWGGPTCMKFKAYCDGLPKQKTSIPDDEDPSGFWHMQPDMSILLDEVISTMLEEKQLKRWCKKNIVYRVKGQEKGAYYQWKCGYAEHYHLDASKQMAKMHLERGLAKRGEVLEEIVNDRFVEDTRKAWDRKQKKTRKSA